MRRHVAVCVLLLLALSAYSQKYKPRLRMYSNDVPPLQIVGVVMGESVENALAGVETHGKTQAGLSFAYPIMVDAPSSLIAGTGADEGVQDAWDVSSGGQLKYQSKIADLYRLSRFGPVSLILIDRQRRIRAIAASRQVVENAFDNRFAELIEYLLLNVGGVEAVPYDVTGMTDGELEQALDMNNPNGLYSWEYAAELQRRETERQGTDAQLTAVYPLLGQEAPDFELPLVNGTGSASLTSLGKDKVTLLVIFWGGGQKSDFTAIAQTTAAMEELKAVDRLHVDWTLKLAEPGTEEYANAQPFAGTDTKVAKASVRGETKRNEAELEREVKPEEFGREQGGEEIGVESKRWGVAIALGLRNFSKKQEFDWQELPTLNGAFGLKLAVQVWQFFAAEASVLPSIRARSFKEDDNHLNVKREILVPLSINVLVRPTVGDGLFSPFVGAGLGPSFVSFRKRIANPDTVWGVPPAYEYWYPSGMALNTDACIGGEFRINSKIYVGLDLRYIFLTIPKFTDEETSEIDAESSEYAVREGVQKDYTYDNATIVVYCGMKF